jgi:hypothetical protein
MHFVEKPGTSIEAMDRITIRASKELRAIPGVRNFGAHIGRAEAPMKLSGRTSPSCGSASTRMSTMMPASPASRR